jgi:hypothetical protein
MSPFLAGPCIPRANRSVLISRHELGAVRAKGDGVNQTDFALIRPDA